MNTTKIWLWFVRETEKARLYSTTQLERQGRRIWVPKSIVEHTSKHDNAHELELPDWFVDKNDL